MSCAASSRPTRTRRRPSRCVAHHSPPIIKLTSSTSKPCGEACLTLKRLLPQFGKFVERMLMEDKASLLKELRKETGCLVFMRSEKEDAEGTAVIKGPSFKVGPLSHLPATLVVPHDNLPREGR